MDEQTKTIKVKKVKEPKIKKIKEPKAIKVEAPKDPRVQLVGAVAKDLKKSAVAGRTDNLGRPMAVLDLATVSCYLNLAAGVCVWNGKGIKADGSFQPLSGGHPLREGNSAFYSIGTLSQKLGAGDEIKAEELIA